MNSYCVDNKTVKENSCIHVLFVIKTVSCLNFFLFYKTILLNKLSPRIFSKIKIIVDIYFVKILATVKPIY